MIERGIGEGEGGGGGDQAAGKGNWQKLSELARMGRGRQSDTRYIECPMQCVKKQKSMKSMNMDTLRHVT